MKINNRQLLLLSNDVPDFEGRLHYRKMLINWPKENKGFKERWFKLKYNMLFYFRMNDGHQLLKEPAGVFILENSDIRYENNEEVPFSFSIEFRNGPEIKYLFSARSDDVVNTWISKLRDSNCGSLKTKLLTLQNKVNEKTEKLKNDKQGAGRAYVFTPAEGDNFADFNSQVAQIGFNLKGGVVGDFDNRQPYSLKISKTDSSKDSEEVESDLILL